MRLCLIISTLLLAGCGNRSEHSLSTLAVLDLAPCPGWEGGRPQTEGEFARAAARERAGRLCANTKLETVATIIETEN